MKYRHVFVSLGLACWFGLQGCGTPEVKPGFYGPYKPASREIWGFGKTITPYGHVHFPSDDGSTVAQAAKPCPVIVFIPGYLEPTLLYESYGNQAASWGYVVVIAHYIGTSDIELQGDISTLLEWLDREQAGDSVLTGAMDLDKLGIAGHSLGGKYALMTALNEPKIKAVFAIDPVDAAADLPYNLLFESFTPELMPQITVPCCFVGAEYPGPINPEDENYHQFYLAAQCPAEEVMVYGTDHASFADDFGGLFERLYDFLFDGKPTRDNRAKNVATRYMVSWFNVFLRGQNEFATYLTGPEAQKDMENGIVRIEVKNMPDMG
jgi:dienelactone hydrolase